MLIFKSIFREHCASANECKLPRPQVGLDFWDFTDPIFISCVLQAPDTPRLLPYSQSEQIEVLTPLLQLIHSLTISQTESCQSLLAPLPSLLLSLGENISVKECGANLRARGSLMESLVFRVETLGLVALLLVAVAQIFGVGGNKTGKKVGTTIVPSYHSACYSVTISTKYSFETLTEPSSYGTIRVKKVKQL